MTINEEAAAFDARAPKRGKPENPALEMFNKTPGYESLARVLSLAYAQSAGGKGRERHGNGKAFDKQPILEIARMVGPGYQVGQIMKKAQEAKGMADKGKSTGAQAELLGVIVYAAAAYLLIEERFEEDADEL